MRASDPALPASRLITPGRARPQRKPPRDTGILAFIVPADCEQLPLVRHRVGSWLAGHRVAVALRRDVVTTVDEAVTSSIRYGYREGDDTGLVAITVHATTDDVVALVADHGSWPSTPDTRGIGLAVIEGIAERVELTHDTGRTTLTARFPRRPAQRTAAWAPEQRSPATEHARSH